MRGRKIEDVMGQRFGRWTVVKRRGRDTFGAALWECICDCGEITIVRGNSLRLGISKSCGCLKRYLIAERSITHGRSYTPEYQAYVNAKARCNNPNMPNYPYYGGRSIKFHFTSFEEF